MPALEAELKEKEDAIRAKDAEIAKLKEQIDLKPTPHHIPQQSSRVSSIREPRQPTWDRRDFDRIRAISDLNLRRLLLAYVSPGASIDQVRVVSRTEGSYHHVVFMELECGDHVAGYVVRIPAHGTKAQWQKEDAYLLDHEVRLMRYIKYNTDIPIPEVLMWDETRWNPIGAPYILMQTLPGKPAYQLWYEDSNGP
jgi:hypothetical protein